MHRSEKAGPSTTNVRAGIGALLAVIGLFGGVILVRWGAGRCTSAFLEAAGRLDVDAYYTGREQDPLIGIGAYWALALMYAAPTFLTVSVVWIMHEPRWSLERWARYALLGFTGLYTLGITSFAFDPSRGGNHTPLIRRYEEFSYEAADLVMAATWTMLVTAAVALGAQALDRAWVRLAVTAVAFAGSACIFAVVFT